MGTFTMKTEILQSIVQYIAVDLQYIANIAIIYFVGLDNWNIDF